MSDAVRYVHDEGEKSGRSPLLRGHGRPHSVV